MTTVNIDIAKLKAAITALTDLAGNIDGQRARATGGTPIGLPTLGDAELGKKSRWLRDQIPELQTRHDLAVLLDDGDTGSASYDVALDSLDMVKSMLGEELAEHLNDVDHETSAEDLDKLNAILAIQQSDPDVMSSMFKELGPDGTVGVLGTITSTMRNSMDAEKLHDLAEHMRSGLATASNSESWQNRPDPYGSSLTYAQMFADDMVRYSVSPMLTDEERDAFREKYPNAQGMNGASILTFLMQEHGYSDDFLVSAASTLDSFEQGMHKGDFGEATGWYSHNGSGNGLVEGTGYDDPMAAIMQNFADNPSAGLRFFDGSPDRQEFYFKDRDWTQDGHESIAMAAESITTDLDNLKNNPEGTTRIAAAFVDNITESEGFNPDDAIAASPYVADLLKFYMPAVDGALNGGRTQSDDDDPPLVPGNGQFDLEYFGHFDHYPEFFKNDLSAITNVAMATADGMQSMAEGVGGFQQTRLNNLAVVMAEDPESYRTGNELRDVIQHGAGLRGFMEHAVGETEIAGAKDRDEQRQVFIDLVGEAAGLVPLPGAESIGELGAKAIDFGWSQAVDAGKGAATEHLASDTKGATEDANVRASDGANEAKIQTYLSLVRAGVIPESEVDPAFLDSSGNLVEFGDLPKEDISNNVRLAMAGVNDYATDFDIDGAYKNNFLKYYSD